MESAEFISQPDRQTAFDYLRVFATFAVIILHISALNWYTTDVNSFEWQVFNFFDSIVRWGVPIFVMISGSLFLNREIPLRKMWSKYILRMLISFIIWSVIYAIFIEEENIVTRLLAVVKGNYHMWFILMIIGIYMCMPFIKPIVENDVRIRYYLILAFVFAFIVPEVTTLVKDFGNETLIQVVGAINYSVNKMNMHIVLGYISYFVLGYYINKTDLIKRQRIMIYVLGILGFMFTVMMDLIVAFKTKEPCSNYYGNFTVNVLFEAIAVFTWFKYKNYNWHKLNSFMKKLSKYSFGAYLVHALIIERLNTCFGVNSLSFNPVFSIVCIGVLVFGLSFAISAILNKIPVVKKYMV